MERQSWVPLGFLTKMKEFLYFLFIFFLVCLVFEHSLHSLQEEEEEERDKPNRFETQTRLTNKLFK